MKRKTKLQKEWEKYLKRLGSKNAELEFKVNNIVLNQIIDSD